MSNLLFTITIQIVCVLVIVNAVSIDSSNCGICDTKKCNKPGTCPAGVVKDACNCCNVCGLEENQLCGFGGKNRGQVWRGACGKEMTCLSMKINPKTNTCQCDKLGFVCGSDGKTYTHCQLEVAKQLSSQGLYKTHDKPCKIAPEIVSITESKAASEENKLVLKCEVYGFPVPKVEWEFESSADSDIVRMPGCDEHISVTEKGGPEALRVTGFLQITNFQRKHEGVYKCITTNDMGVNKDKINIVYKPKNAEDL